MKNYCVGIIYNRMLDKILLLYRNKMPYKEMYNGIGGNIEKNERPEDAMFREFREETGLEAYQLLEVVKIGTFITPKGVMLHCFAIHVSLDSFENIERVTPEGILGEFSLADEALYDVRNPKFAGDGNLPFFIWEGKNLLKGR